MTKKKRTIFITVCILAGAIFITGLVMLLYPIVGTAKSGSEMESTISRFKETAAAQPPSDSGGSGEGDAAQAAYPGLLKIMKAYNEQIYEDGQKDLKDPFSYEEASFDLTQYGFEENVIGYISIPKIDVELPIYLGATNENMKHGAVHLSQTSLPIGGGNTNSVIAAHRGTVNRGPMFQEIDQLEIGDSVQITNLWETMDYEVIEIRVIEPDEVKEVMIREGEELLTLLSCHPYPENYQRILVICKRV